MKLILSRVFHRIIYSSRALADNCQTDTHQLKIANSNPIITLFTDKMLWMILIIGFNGSGCSFAVESKDSSGTISTDVQIKNDHFFITGEANKRLVDMNVYWIAPNAEIRARCWRGGTGQDPLVYIPENFWTVEPSEDFIDAFTSYPGTAGTPSNYSKAITNGALGEPDEYGNVMYHGKFIDAGPDNTGQHIRSECFTNSPEIYPDIEGCNGEIPCNRAQIFYVVSADDGINVFHLPMHTVDGQLNCVVIPANNATEMAFNAYFGCQEYKLPYFEYYYPEIVPWPRGQ